MVTEKSMKCRCDADIREEIDEEIGQLTLIEYDQFNGGKDPLIQAQKPIKLMENQPKDMVYGSNG